MDGWMDWIWIAGQHESTPSSAWLGGSSSQAQDQAQAVIHSHLPPPQAEKAGNSGPGGLPTGPALPISG